VSLCFGVLDRVVAYRAAPRAREDHKQQRSDMASRGDHAHGLSDVSKRGSYAAIAPVRLLSAQGDALCGDLDP
jgi:hypothetical protein